jgi:hypothetical protein
VSDPDPIADVRHEPLPGALLDAAGVGLLLLGALVHAAWLCLGPLLDGLVELLTAWVMGWAQKVLGR